MSTLDAPLSPGGISRRRFIGYLLAAPVLVAAADLSRPAGAEAAGIPTVQLVDDYDLSDLLTQAAMGTAALLRITVGRDGTATFELPRAEVGQGIQTAIAMIIAEELELPVAKVRVPLADANPELVWNQLTGGSNSVHALYDQVRVAAAVARGQIATTAARQLHVEPDALAFHQGTVSARGRTLTYGRLTALAAVRESVPVLAELKPRAAYTVIGTPQVRTDAREAVTGRKVFAMDLKVPHALPTMLCRAPTINGSPVKIHNLAEVRRMPGVHDVALIPRTDTVPGGVAVRCTTFGQCIDAVRALDVTWSPGTLDTKSDADVLADLVAAELPLHPAPPLADVLDRRFTFYFRPGDPLETNCAVANVTPTSAEIWSSLKSPIYAQQTIARMLGLPDSAVTCHVTQGGGSFGRHLFADAAIEAAAVSRAMGKPVKLMWHRTDNFRHGRVHPMCTSRVRLAYSGSTVLGFDQRHTSVATDFSHGVGEILSAMVAGVPEGNFLAYSQSIFELTANSPYDFGPTDQLLNEIYDLNTVHTSSVRNIYSPEVTTARELLVDELARQLNQDPYLLRRTFLRDARMTAVLDTVAKAGRWGAPAPGRVQGLGVHHEYKSYAACLIELDMSAASRTIRDGYGGPRVTRVTFAVDVGLPINTLGLEAQILGGAMDGIAQVLSYSLHLQHGHFLEGSWDNAFYTRQWNTPPEVKIIILPASQSEPGGAGELGVAATMAAVANAYARATGKLPTEFPINHNGPLGFTPLPTTPSIPQSPTDGLKEGKR